MCIGDHMSDTILYKRIQYLNETAKGKIPIKYLFLQKKNRNRNKWNGAEQTLNMLLAMFIDFAIKMLISSLQVS